MILASLFVLEFARKDVVIRQFTLGQTPATEYATDTSDGPVVIVAHGFAGSQQMMQGYALPLARAGYRVVTFEFYGHGRHPIPMSGDVTSADGTTRLLVDQTRGMIDAMALQDQKIALIGHSMATDILVRAAETRSDIGPVVLLSAFSQVIDSDTPDTLLLVTGAWEPGLRGFAQEALQMVHTGASEGQTVTKGAITRRAVAAPFSEHVSVLHSRVARSETLKWLDQAYGRTSDVAILPSGWAILGLLAGLVLIFRPIASMLPKRHHTSVTLSPKKLAVILATPAIVTPLIAIPLAPEFLPVLIADYLGLHLMVFGVIQLALLRLWGVTSGRIAPIGFCLLVLWCVIFGAALDRYAANFWPIPQRLWIIAVLMIGAVPYMIADATLTAQAGFLKRLCTRMAFLISLGIAVAFDFQGLFFLIMIAPVLVLFYIVFGTMGRDVAARSGALTSGLALGLMLAWALGVSFPLFQT
ncbi:alpha/beta fold hydrolase [Sulfitobacter sp. 1151]|uniref:Alpha/beta fold hydrolase n=1 Tax=Parasulfitobacter algicola TaxID=2614809 RepID=A0ABX2IRW1_9RHOB|nr:alpha/beta fold hydrolase [Sulfitobacter algicola]